MKSKYIVAALLSMMVLFTSLPVHAAQVSGNDANNGIMLLSADDSISTVETYYPNTILPGSIQKVIYISKFSDVINVDVDLFNIYFSQDSDYNSLSNVINIYNNIQSPIITGDSSSPIANIIDYRFYILVNGQKYYFDAMWESIIFDQYIAQDTTSIGCELSFSISSGDFDMFFDFNMSGTSNSNSSGTTENYQYTGTIYTPYQTATKELAYTLSISWTDFQWNIFKSSETDNSILKNISQHLINWSTSLSSQLTTLQNTIVYEIQVLNNNLISKLNSVETVLNNINTNIKNKLDTLNTSINNNFSDLLSKMDEDQEEIINGYDPVTGDSADSDFNAGADELHSVENNLFQSAEYDEVDYSKYNDFFSLTGVAGAMSFVASFFESLYASLGIYAVPFTIGLVLIIITRILGYQNFSAGGG